MNNAGDAGLRDQLVERLSATSRGWRPDGCIFGDREPERWRAGL